MAKIKVVNRRDGRVAVGSSFRNIPSETIFSFGKFSVETNFSNRTIKSNANRISSFVKPITLESLNLTNEDSLTILNYTTNVKLNINPSDLGSYVKYGSLKELLRVSVENIITEYPSSIFSTYKSETGNTGYSVFNYTYNPNKDESTFIVPENSIQNTFGLVINTGNEQLPQNNELRNLNIGYKNYVIWRPEFPDQNENELVGFTGLSNTTPYLTIVVKGNPFPELSASTQMFAEYHIKPKPLYFNRFYESLSNLEKYMMINKVDNGYLMTFKKPNILENGGIVYSNQEILWSTTDNYNIDIVGISYSNLLNNLGDIGDTYDKFKTDMVTRFLVPQSLLLYDKTQNEKISKLLRVYGRNFDNLKVYIDAIATINKLTYDKTNNIPDN